MPEEDKLDDQNKPKIPIPKLDDRAHGEMSDTAIFINQKVDQAIGIASEAHEMAAKTESSIMSLTSGIKERDDARNRELDQLREAFKESNENTTRSFNGFTEQLKELNKNLTTNTIAMGKLDSLKEGQTIIRTELVGQSKRLTSHITEQASVEAVTDTKLKNLVKNTGNDYVRVEGSINSLRSELKGELKEAVTGVAPSVQLIQFIKWFAGFVVVLIGVTWTIVQIYGEVAEHNDRKNNEAKIEAILPKRTPTVNESDSVKTP